MIITWFTDPHLGVSRAQNTTMASAAALRKRIFVNAMEIAVEAKKAGHFVACLGDVFDKHSNPEHIVSQGAQLLEYVDAALGGNHDVKNVQGAVSSLMLIDQLMQEFSPVIMSPDISQPYFKRVGADEASLFFIPHCLTQEIFEQSVRAACADTLNWGDHCILCLHCNVGEAYGQVEAEGSTLALTEELQELVIQHFGLTMVGHEHKPRKLHKGKIVVMGNLLPLSFGELEHRFVYEYDTQTRKLNMGRLFDNDAETMGVMAHNLDTQTSFGEAAYVTIGGTIKPEDYPAMARNIQRIWSNSPHTLMVSNVVEIDRPDALSRTRVESSKQTLMDLVRNEAKVKGFATELAELEKMQ